MVGEIIIIFSYMFSTSTLPHEWIGLYNYHFSSQFSESTRVLVMPLICHANGVSSYVAIRRCSAVTASDG